MARDEFVQMDWDTWGTLSQCYMNAWLKTQNCTYPRCDCGVHQVVASIKQMAKSVGCEFEPDRDRISRSAMCKAAAR